MKKKMVSAVLAAVMTASVLAGCGSSSGSSSESASASDTTAAAAESTAAASSGDPYADLPDSILDGTVTATPEMYPNTDLSDPYTVNMYLIGDTPNDWDEVLGKVNDYLKPFNTTLNVTFMSWSDYQTMYTLVLAGGEQVDLIFTAPWCYMYSEAAKGSFYELTEDFRSTYMPLSQKYQAPESWDETTISGKTIAAPSNTMTPMGKIVAIRQDLAEKYGITGLSSWDDYKNFALTIAEKETPSSGIYADAAAGENNELWEVYNQQFNTMYALDNNYLDMIYFYNEEGKLPSDSDIQLAYGTDEFRAFAKDMKEMADAGCWSRGALTNTIQPYDAFGNLQGASFAWNATVFTYMEQAEQTEGVTCAAYDLTSDKLVRAESYSNNDMAITAGSGNPERAAMVLDLMKNDTYLNRLLLLGVEGEHYTIDDEGNYTELDKAADYPAMTISASWAIKNDNLNEAGQDQREIDMSDAWEERVEANPTITFVFDDSNVSAYVSNLTSILQDYVPSLMLGLVDDPDANIDEMMQKLEDAGLQNFYDEFYSQYDAWLESRS